jgi:hypothetical protein
MDRLADTGHISDIEEKDAEGMIDMDGKNHYQACSVVENPTKNQNCGLVSSQSLSAKSQPLAVRNQQHCNHTNS